MSLQDEFNMHDDAEKIEELIDSDVVSMDEIANATIVLVEPSCKCDKGLEPIGNKLLCPECFMEGVDAE